MPLLTHNQVWELSCGPFFPEAINYVLNEFKTESWIVDSLKGPLGTHVVERPKSRSFGHK